ncbi:MAG: hypothetical protein WDO68_21535 [Gammaproteobacteria bacterium]
MSAIDIYVKAVVVLDAWSERRPDKTFFGMAVDDFRKIVDRSSAARAEVAALEGQVREALKRRDAADEITRRAVIRVVNGVKGDPTEGEDGELLRVMGYVPHSARGSIMSAARRNKAKAAASDREAVG